MEVVDATTFERLLDGLSDDEFATLVKEIWNHRSIPCRVVTAVPSDVTDDEIIVVRVLPVTSRLRLRARLATVGLDLKDVDVLVAPLEVDRLRAVTRDADVTFVGPAELRNLTLYAIDRDTCRELFQRYFDRPPVSGNVDEKSRERLGVFYRRTEAFAATLRSRYADAIVVLLVIALLVGILVGITGPLSGYQSGLFPQAATEEPTEESISATLERVASGDVSPLVEQHRTAVQSSAVVVTITHHHGRGELLTRARWDQSTHVISITSDGSYRISINGMLLPATIGSNVEPVQMEVRGSDGSCHATVYQDARQLSPERICDRIQTDGVHTYAGAVTGSYVDRYLNRTEPRIQSIEGRPSEAYRIVAEQPPSDFPVAPTNYTAVAVVDEHGMVSELWVRYETPVIRFDDPVEIYVTVDEPNERTELGHDRSVDNR